jgi:hypothetical protein
MRLRLWQLPVAGMLQYVRNTCPDVCSHDIAGTARLSSPIGRFFHSSSYLSFLVTPLAIVPDTEGVSKLGVLRSVHLAKDRGYDIRALSL